MAYKQIFNPLSGQFDSVLATPVTEVDGGTGQSTYTAGDTLYASATDTLSKLAIGSTGDVLTVVAGLPAWMPPSGGGGGGPANYAISSSATQAVTSGSPVDVTNLTVTITTTGNPVALMLIGDSTASYIQVSQSSTNASGDIYFVRGSTTLSQQQFGGGTALAASVFTISAVSAFAHFDAVAAGTYTYKIQSKVTGSAQVDFGGVKLVAYELMAPAPIPTVLARYSFDTTNGYGSTNNKVRKWSNNPISTDVGGILTVSNDATNGLSITANVRVRLSISYTDIGSGSMEIGIVKNGNQGTTIIQSVTNSTVIARGAAPANNLPNGISVTDIAEIGDYYWSQTDGTSAAAANTEAGIFILAEQIS